MRRRSPHALPRLQIARRRSLPWKAKWFVVARRRYRSQRGRLNSQATPKWPAARSAHQLCHCLAHRLCPGLTPLAYPSVRFCLCQRAIPACGSDGRHNPNRGLPRATAIEASPVVEGRVSTRTAHVTTSHRCVQVGTFSNAANTRATGQRFLGMGLPVGLTTSSRGSVVLLGPFTIALALNRGLSAARNAGFGDAFPRN